MNVRFPRSLRPALIGLLAVLLHAAPAAAQTGSITGTVTDSLTGTPLPGVNVVIVGTQTGASTDPDGNYTIPSLEPGSYDVQASFIGYMAKTITDVQVSADEASQVDITLAESTVQLEDVVVVGYGTQRREDVTGSVSSVDVDEAEIGISSSPQELIQGKAAGVSVIRNGGEPGGGVTVRIRGGTSLSASNEPLYVVDGVPLDNGAITPGGDGPAGDGSAARNPLNIINPSDIESIDILKDAAATAIYGARGANGVVLITTKGGDAGQLQLSYNASVSASTPTRTLDVLSGPEYEAFVRQQVQEGNIGWEDLNGDGEINRADDQITDKDGNGTADVIDGLGSSNTDWQDAVLQTGVSQRHNLAFSGGTEETQYRASLGYETQEGIVISSAQEKVTGRLNADHSAFDGRLDLDLNMTAGYIFDDNIVYNETGGFEGGLFTNVFKFNPTYPVRQNEGFYEIGAGAQGVRNPVAIAEELDDFAKSTRIIGNFAATYELVEGLSAKVNLGVERSQASRRLYFPATNPIGANNNGEAFQRENERTSRLLEVTGTYNGLFRDDHSVNLVGGYSWQNWLNEGFGATGRDFVTDLFRYNNLGAGNDATVLPYSYAGENRLISFFGRLNYNYDSRYLLSVSLRRDGSSRFGENTKWGVFPSASLAWRVTNEEFVSLPEVFTDLKLRIGHGVTGNQDGIANYPSLALFAASADLSAIFNGDESFVGVGPTQFANPNIQWEETATTNAGIDYGFFDGRLSGSIDVYQKNTDNLLLNINVPQPAVVDSRIENIGSIRNRGLELAVDALVLDREDLSFNLGANFSTNKNEVVEIGGNRQQITTGTVSGAGLSGVTAQFIKPGLPVGTFVGPVFAGVENGVQTFEDWEDTDGDGLGDEFIGTTTEPKPGDRRVLGNAQPDFEYGLNGRLTWKDWDAGIFFRGLKGRDLLNNTALEYTSKFLANTNVNFLADALDGVDGEIAFAESSPIYSSRWVQDASFLRLESLSLGYTLRGLPYVSQARLYARGNNLFVITPYEGFDPEVNTSATGTGSIGIDYLNYPKPRSFTVGVDLSF